jgi:hypothetical protein
MPKQSRKIFRNIKRSIASKALGVVRIAGRVLHSPTSTTSVTGQDIYPGNTTLLGDRLNGFSQLFQLFRFTKFAVKLSPSAFTVGLAIDLVQDTVSAPSTMLQMSELATFTLNSGPETVSSHVRMRVPQGQPNWYATTANTDHRLSTQGVFLHASSTAGITLFFTIDYEIEFRLPKSIADGARSQSAFGDIVTVQDYCRGGINGIAPPSPLMKGFGLSSKSASTADVFIETKSDEDDYETLSSSPALTAHVNMGGALVVNDLPATALVNKGVGLSQDEINMINTRRLAILRTQKEVSKV